MIYNQKDFNIRTEWSTNGIEQLADISDVIIIIDILSFSTSVDIATNNGAFVFPYAYKDESALEYAKYKNALLASMKRKDGEYSLSPNSLINIPKKTKIVLPSPNGSTLSLRTKKCVTLCGCLRNAKVVAEYAMIIGNNIAIIPAGEKWDDGNTRYSFEDLLGAGAIINYLKGSLSPESLVAKYLFENIKNNILENVRKCISGKELIDRGFSNDVNLACELNISNCVPLLKGQYYENTINKVD